MTSADFARHAVAHKLHKRVFTELAFKKIHIKVPVFPIKTKELR